ncbi:MAG: PKD domain-containing protein [Bacteroidota bacterium]
MPDFVTCDGFNVQFFHNSTGANSIFWDLGDLATLADTSHLDNPTYTYADTGTYIIKLVINRGTGCADSTYRAIGVFPGFFPQILPIQVFV